MEQQTTGRVSQLEKEVHSLGSELHQQSRSLGELKAVQEMQGQRLDKIGDGVDKLIEHKTNNPTFTPSIVMALMAAVFLAFQGVTLYIDMQMNPNTSRLDRIEQRLVAIDEFRAQAHYEVARAQEGRDEQKAMWEEIRGIRGSITDLRVQTATNITAIHAVGDYVKEHVALTHVPPVMP